jgi:[protein-PII] uridylyltransferase
VPLNNRFQIRNGFIEIRYSSVFRHFPYALLEVFLLLEQHPEIKGVRADTIRAIRGHRHLIDEEFRDDIRCRSLFMEIIRQTKGVTHELRRMNVYGVLAAYLPVFEHITGLMQYDLFHTYTVDEHILFVVRNLRRFAMPEFAGEVPLCSQVVTTIPKPELLCLAGLFHDIAKGRGGDHSELGGRDAREFCERHDLSNYDTDLVGWLVENHLLMSTIAQREDISDPVVINRFANLVANPVRLDYLYLLTVADIRGTNPDLWNTWKGALLSQLYYGTRRALQRGLQDPLERAEHIQQVQTDARRLLSEFTSFTADPGSVWQRLGEEYFLRHTAEQVSRHTRLLAERQDNMDCVVSIQPVTERGGTEIFIHAPADDELFTLITAVLDQLGLNVVDAGIITTDDGYVLNTFHVLDQDGGPLQDALRIDAVHATLTSEIESEDRKAWHVSRRTPRRYRHFPIQTHIAFKLDEADQRTVMELITADRPGLLSQVGRAFSPTAITGRSPNSSRWNAWTRPSAGTSTTARTATPPRLTEPRAAPPARSHCRPGPGRTAPAGRSGSACNPHHPPPAGRAPAPGRPPAGQNAGPGRHGPLTRLPACAPESRSGEPADRQHPARRPGSPAPDGCYPVTVPAGHDRTPVRALCHVPAR